MVIRMKADAFCVFTGILYCLESNHLVECKAAHEQYIYGAGDGFPRFFG